ncbi:MAG: MarR family winged helix-turn-helix transcriptional regulator [Syntrophomonadales bacterium]|jgi:DNA-binding MarR family transcriptional regulator
MVGFTEFTCFLMRSAMKKIDRYLAFQLEEYGISVPQSFVLFALLEEDGSTLKEIGTKAQIDSSSMTVLVDKLENEGYLERRLDPQDRRAIRVFLTPKGRDLAGKVWDLAVDFNRQLHESLGDTEDLFQQGLRRIIRSFD